MSKIGALNSGLQLHADSMWALVTAVSTIDFATALLSLLGNGTPRAGNPGGQSHSQIWTSSGLVGRSACLLKCLRAFRRGVKTVDSGGVRDLKHAKRATSLGLYSEACASSMAKAIPSVSIRHRGPM